MQCEANGPVCDNTSGAMHFWNRRADALAGAAPEPMQCRCDLDNWQPDPRTGHSWVCPIHKATIGKDQAK